MRGGIGKMSESRRSQSAGWFRLQCIAQFWNHSASKVTGIEKGGQISTSWLLEKFRGETGKISEWILRIWHKTKPLIYFWQGVTQLSGTLEVGCQYASPCNWNQLPNTFRQPLEIQPVTFIPFHAYQFITTNVTTLTIYHSITPWEVYNLPLP